MPELIYSTAQIDGPWLDSVLAGAGIEAPPINQVRIEPIGAGNTGVTVKVNIGYERPCADAPRSVICKLHPPDQARIDAVKQAGVFIIESNAQKLLAEGSDAAIPKCLFVAASADGGQFNLVCEDLSQTCELGDQINGCSIEEAAAAIQELARFHRQFWNEPRLDQLPWIRPRIPLPDNISDLLEGRLSALLAPEQHDVVRRATPLVYDWLALQPSNRTLIHVDCRVDNVLFDHRGSTPRAYLIDFALVNVGDAVADVAYFLTSSLSPEDRMVCEAELLARHTEEIAQKDPSYTIEQAQASYRTNIVSSLYLSLYAALGVPDTPETNLLLTRLFERNCAAVSHWTTL